MITSRPITELEYMIVFAPCRTAFMDRCAEEALSGGVLLGAEKDGKLVGFLGAVKEAQKLRVLHAFTLPEARGCGVFTELLHSLTKLVGTGKYTFCTVRVHISSRHAFHDPIVHVCKKLGFIQTESVHVFTCRRDRDEHWRTFMEHRGLKMCALLSRWGYETVSFAKAGPDVIAQLRSPEKTGYGSTFDIAAYLDNPGKKAAWDMSFAALKENRLAAYTLVTHDAEKSVVFQLISDAVWARGSGVILLPFVQSMNQFYQSNCQTAAYAMYGSNQQANDFRRKALVGFYTEESETENFHYIPQ